ncbi:hypothetical protein KKG36_00425 [Patescibacteria group bacterium]|nr:hypothetical protein [Patescibacteria group bacterium]
MIKIKEFLSQLGRTGWIILISWVVITVAELTFAVMLVIALLVIPAEETINSPLYSAQLKVPADECDYLKTTSGNWFYFAVDVEDVQKAQARIEQIIKDNKGLTYSAGPEDYYCCSGEDVYIRAGLSAEDADAFVAQIRVTFGTAPNVITYDVKKRTSGATFQEDCHTYLENLTFYTQKEKMYLSLLNNNPDSDIIKMALDGLEDAREDGQIQLENLKDLGLESFTGLAARIQINKIDILE